MYTAKWDEIEGTAVAEEDAKGVTIRVLMGENVGAPTFTMRRFEIAPGGHTPFHAHAWEHEVYILSGTGKVRRRAGLVRLRSRGRGAQLRQRRRRALLLPLRHPGQEDLRPVTAVAAPQTGVCGTGVPPRGESIPSVAAPFG